VHRHPEEALVEVLVAPPYARPNQRMELAGAAK
jgi:hypothetical protein